MSYAQSPLYQGAFINQWLLSDIIEKEICFELSTQEGDTNEWLWAGTGKYDNPGRAGYAKARLLAPRQEPQAAQKALAGTVRWWAGEAKLHAYIPFEDPRVTSSGFWYTPALLTQSAFCELDVPEAQVVTLRLTTCGNATLWLDGEVIAAVGEYTRNTEATCETALTLQKGRRHLTLYMEDIAERDTDFFFRLECIGAQGVQQCIHLGECTPEDIARVQGFLENMRFERMTYTHGDVVLRSQPQPEGKPLHLCITGATEENHTAGLLWRKECIVPRDGAVSLGDCTALPVGFLDLTVTASIGPLSLRRKTAVESVPAFSCADDDISARKKTQLSVLARHGEENINRAVALLETGGDLALAQQLIERQVDDIGNRKDCSDFHMIFLPYIYKKYRHAGMLSEALFQKIRDVILNFRYWHDESGNDVMWFFSENHALMFHACQLLCGELFPDDYFPTSGRTGVQMQQKASALLIDWFARFFREGCAEWNSSAYFPINSLGFSNLYLQTQNQKIRNLAKQAMDVLYRNLALFSIRGCMAVSAGRTYEKELFGNLANGTTSMSYVLFGHGVPNQAGKGVTALCLGDYAPAPEIRALCEAEPGKAAIIRLVQGPEGYANLYAYKTAPYLLSTALRFRPGCRGYQEHLLQATFSADAQLFLSQPGELMQFGSGRPSYWAGSASLPCVEQYRAFASVLYEGAASSPADFIHLYLPRPEMDQVIASDGRIYACKADGYVMIACSSPLHELQSGPYAHREWRSEQLRTVFIIRCGTREEFGSFDRFIETMRARSAVLDPEQLRYSWDDPEYGLLRASWESPLNLTEESALCRSVDLVSIAQ